MRKTIEYPTSRVRRRFLLFPKMIGTEWRWLEFASWLEIYGMDYHGGYWVEEKWIDYDK